ncbi:ubiquitin carboxyl-terminal hydrolase 26 [Moschus berezovskii]|uniref:ubiquitin carboxyl-terminal hydrolase 26 n=1 Tax=Moschus berezovskii TaxID=68408 RepID=UPI0024441FB6|nr:ubiquitin carboxyl-terminal hydrolase 26 [Moschus berezovskii]
MVPIVVHGFVQLWNKKNGMSKSKEAAVEGVGQKKKTRLVVYFINGEITTFQLNNNIKSVVVRSCGEKVNHLHLTFQNNSFLFMEKLSSTDVKKLKAFLDTVCQNHLPPPIRPDVDSSAFARTTVQKTIDETSFQKVGKKSDSQRKKEENNGTPSSASESLTSTYEQLLEDEYGKRRKKPSSDFQKESRSVRKRKSKKHPLRHTSHNEKKELKLKELKQNKLDLEFLFKISPYLHGTNLFPKLTENIYFTFLSEAEYDKDDPHWDRLKLTLDCYPEKLWQGFPNLGNTCYMNAVLQSLFFIPSFADDLLNRSFPWCKITPDALSMCLAQMFVLKDIYNINIKKRLLVNIKQTISAVAGIFSDNTQNDAHEFLGHYLNQMKENMEKLNTAGKTKIESEKENLPQPVLVDSAASQALLCPVVSNFEFELLCSITCKACGHVVLKTEVSNYLSINLPQGQQALPFSVQSSFDFFFGSENLEYICEQCQHRKSLIKYTFSRLPRVLIVHLKRYSFTEFRSLKKDDQEVIISKNLKISSHCNENTRPPFPLNKKAHLMNLKVLKMFRNINSEAISKLTPSAKMTSEFMNSLPSHIIPDEESEPEKDLVHHEGSKEEKEKDPGKYSILKILESASANSEDAVIIARELLTVALVMNMEDGSFSLREITISNPDICQKVTENPKLNEDERIDMFVDFEALAKTTEDEKAKISEEFSPVAEQTPDKERMKIYEQALWLALLQSFPKPTTQKKKCTEKLKIPKESGIQGTEVNSPGASRHNKKSGKKGSLGTEKTEAASKKPKGEAEMEDHQAYRLIGVLSHLGKSLNSGHYITDAYDFAKQEWFTYNDLHVSNIEEATMQKARLSSGYVFFYMHNEIFEELLERESSPPQSTEAGKISQE